MINFVQEGDVLDLDPGATVPAGTGKLFGAALFGVAAVDAVSGTASSFVVRGVVTIAKTSALAISRGRPFVLGQRQQRCQQDQRCAAAGGRCGGSRCQPQRHGQDSADAGAAGGDLIG
jgi:predicted RecA/RadA family phage recombinase